MADDFLSDYRRYKSFQTSTHLAVEEGQHEHRAGLGRGKLLWTEPAETHGVVQQAEKGHVGQGAVLNGCMEPAFRWYDSEMWTQHGLTDKFVSMRYYCYAGPCECLNIG